METPSPGGSEDHSTRSGIDPGTDPDIDPAADLALLRRTQSGVVAEYHLDAGPWWYAGLGATFIGGLSLFGGDFRSSWHLLAGVEGVIAGSFLGWHDHRRRQLRVRPSTRSALIVLPIVVATWIILGLWGTAISTLGIDRFVPGYAVLAWLVTTVALLGIGAGMRTLRRKATRS